MGTRLYPLTKNESIIERLAGVPEGTTQKLRAFEKLRESINSDEWHDKLSDSPAMDRLYDFELFGWGKLNSEQWDLAKAICGDEEYYSGSTKDPEQVRLMLNALHDQWKETLGLINIDELDGVYWS